MISKSDFVSRIGLISILIFVVAGILIARLYFVQIIHGDEFSARADRQYVRPSQSLYDRGTIFFEDKEGRLVSGATLRSGYTVAISPKDLENPEDAYNLLSNIIELDEEIFLHRAGKSEDPYEEIANKVEKEDALKIDSFDIPGLNIYKERWRFYPGNNLATQALGFVAYDENTLSGRYGLENYYDDILTREESDIYVNFFAEIFSNINKTIFSRAQAREGDVVTTIEPSVQLQLEEKLQNIHEEWNSTLTAGVIINPKTGEIYSLGVHPRFDLNAFQKEEDPRIFSNPIAENIYEMGSIIKPLTVAAGLDRGVITAETTYNDKGFIELNTAKISNFDGEGRGVVPMQEVLSQSLNTGVAFIVTQLGNDVFADYMRSYGIGEETGIDLPNEGVGLISNLDSPRDLEYATASFGQGIAMTPIATVRALSTLANGGKLVTPHIAKQIKYKSGIFKNVTYNEGARVLKEETSEEITRMLVKVVDDALLDGTVKLDNYSIAAKTGTAQIAKVDGRGYYDDRFLHSFFGYFPAYDPEFLIFLYTVEPKEVRYASQTLTRPFMEMVSFLINYYEIPPDR